MKESNGQANNTHFPRTMYSVGTENDALPDWQSWRLVMLYRNGFHGLPTSLSGRSLTLWTIVDNHIFYKCWRLLRTISLHIDTKLGYFCRFCVENVMETVCPTMRFPKIYNGWMNSSKSDCKFMENPGRIDTRWASCHGFKSSWITS